MALFATLTSALTGLLLLFDTTASTVATRAVAGLTSQSVQTTSTGTPFRGRLLNAARLPEASPDYKLQFYSRKNGFTFATTELVAGIQGVAAAMTHQFPGTGPLVLGSLSRKRGGDIPLSRSHNSGRDLDIAFYMETHDGEPVDSRYHNFLDDGRSQQRPRSFRFDRRRNWALCRALLEEPSLRIQWLILQPALEELLVAYAREQREPPELIERFQQVTDLPGYAGRHDNHLHVRIQCSPEDWAQGCDPAGPVWPWHHELVAAMKRASVGPARELKAPEPHRRRAALAQVRTSGQFHLCQ